MTAAEGREVVESIYERWNRNEGDLAPDLFDQDVEIHQMSRMFDSARDFRGREGLERSSEELRAAFEAIQWQPESWTEVGDCLVVRMHGTGKGAHSGAEVEVDFAHLWRVEAGLVTLFHVYETEEEALEAARA